MGLIAWYSPFSAAGWLFPGVGLVCGLSLVAALLLWGTAAASGDRIWKSHPGRKVSTVAVILLAGASVIANVGYSHPRRDSQYPRFVGADLQRGQLRRESPEYQDQIKSAVYGFPHASVIVLPEATFLAVSPVTDFFFQDEFKALADTDRVLIAGATIAGPGDQYRNGFILRGAQVGFVDERVPVPVAMWKPFLDSGAPLHLMAPSTINVHGLKTAVLVCYEMVIPWTAATALAEHPDELVGIANDDWAAGAPIVPKLQRNTLRGWARLGGIDSVFAANVPLEVAR
jgi:apolipoprotein N-acyltransferase